MPVRRQHLSRSRPATAVRVWLVIGALVAAGCGTVSESFTPYPIETRALPAEVPCVGVEVEQLLIGTAMNDSGPIWGEPASGPGGLRMILVWPPGFAARRGTDGVQILDPSGRVLVAQGGVLRNAQLCQLEGDKWAYVSSGG
jgi:hypothetical protein